MPDKQEIKERARDVIGDEVELIEMVATQRERAALAIGCGFAVAICAFLTYLLIVTG